MIEPIELYEYKSEKNLCPEALKEIERFLKKKKLEKCFKITPSSLCATSWVGVVKCRKFQIQVLPKLLRSDAGDEKTILKNLLFMLSYTKKLKIKNLETAILNKSENPFLEILIGEFANSLFEELKKYIPKSYIRQEENRCFLKGKLQFAEHIRYNLINQAHFYCAYDEFSENNLLNQLFYYVATCLSDISMNSENKKILDYIKNFYSDVTFVQFDYYKASQVKLSRNQSAFEKPLQLAKMFVEHSSTDMTTKQIKNIALLWDMNELFEEFIFEILRRNLEKGWRFAAQKGRKLLRNDNSRRRNTFVDILAQKEKDNEKIVLDTKYKKFENCNSFSNGDVFQVSTYCLLHNAKKAVLIYPQWTSEKPDIPPYCLNTDDSKDEYKIKFSTVNLMQDLKENLKSCIQEVYQILEAI